MSAVSMASLYVTEAELALLLEGCGISGLWLPGDVGEALQEGIDISRALASLVREELLMSGTEEDGLLDYSSPLRAILRVLRDAQFALVARLSGERSPRVLQLGRDSAVLIACDALRAHTMCLRLGDPGDLLEELVDDAAATTMLSTGQGGSFDLEGASTTGGILLTGELYVRNGSEPLMQIQAERREDGDVLVAEVAGVVRREPFTAQVLLQMAREAGAS